VWAVDRADRKWLSQTLKLQLEIVMVEGMLGPNGIAGWLGQVNSLNKTFQILQEKCESKCKYTFPRKSMTVTRNPGAV